MCQLPYFFSSTANTDVIIIIKELIQAPIDTLSNVLMPNIQNF